jgi:hypothetical protein
MSTLGTNLQTGGAQWLAALKNGQNNVNSLLRQAGVIRPDGTSAGGVGGAFDPANLVAGETLTPEQIASMTAGTSYGAEGAYSEAYQAGGNVAADQAMQSRRRGLGGGGLAKQRQELALMQTQGGAANVTQALLTGLGEQYGNVNQAYANETQRITDEQVKAADEAAAIGSVTNPEVDPTTVAPTAFLPNSVGKPVATSNRGNYTKKGTPQGSNVPKNPKPGMAFKGNGGVTFVYRSKGPKGRGWYHK